MSADLTLDPFLPCYANASAKRVIVTTLHLPVACTVRPEHSFSHPFLSDRLPSSAEVAIPKLQKRAERLQSGLGYIFRCSDLAPAPCSPAELATVQQNGERQAGQRGKDRPDVAIK